MPSNGDPWAPGHGDSRRTGPPSGQPWGQPWGPQGQPAQAPLPPQAPPPPPQAPPRPYSQPPQQPPARSEDPEWYGQQHPRQAPQPPSHAPAQGATPGAADETQVLPPISPAGPPPPAEPTSSAPLVSGGGAPVPDGGDDATRVIRPVSAGPPPERDTESTTVLRRPLSPERKPAQPPGSAPSASGAVPPPSPGAPYGTRPGAVGGGSPHSDFEGLFRSDARTDGSPGGLPADATRQLPPVDPSGAPPFPPYGGGGHGHGGDRGGYDRPSPGRDSGERRGIPRLAVAGIVVVGCAVVGLAAGAAMTGGDSSAPLPQAKASAPAPGGEESPSPSQSSPSPSPTVDLAEVQAKELDKLLADSNNSRSAVIRAVENIKKCEKLGKAASDLRDAARQRNDLVSRLNELEIDRLPDHRKLADALTRAWRASATADNHYAAWADQVAGKKGCPKGMARTTSSTAEGNKASGVATAAKKEAAGLWNPTARRYGLPERRYGQL
nr:hypothetical protein [Streptomyces taklimakanensis]